MNWGLLSFGFGFGTIKFLFAHWSTYWAFGESDFATIAEIFIAVTAGAWFSMSIFYWTSGLLMKKAAEKRTRLIKEAKAAGKEIKAKKIFTKANKSIVWIKRSIGIYGVTFLAPLLLSIPLGSIICAKFYGDRKKPFPLMLINTASYSALMCLWIYATQ